MMSYPIFKRQPKSLQKIVLRAKKEHFEAVKFNAEKINAAASLANEFEKCYSAALKMGFCRNVQRILGEGLNSFECYTTAENFAWMAFDRSTAILRGDEKIELVEIVADDLHKADLASRQAIEWAKKWFVENGQPLPSPLPVLLDTKKIQRPAPSDSANYIFKRAARRKDATKLSAFKTIQNIINGLFKK